MSTPKPKYLPQTYNAQSLRELPVEQRRQMAAEILNRYCDGEEVRAMTKDYGVSHVTLYSLLFQLFEDDWRDAQIARALAGYDDGQAELTSIKRRVNTAKDILEIAKLRELTKLTEVQLKSRQWTLEKLLRRLYGNDVPTVGAGMVQINIGISRPEANLGNAIEVGTTLAEENNGTID